LDFKVNAPIHLEALGNTLLRPWELLHGVKELALIGDIEDSMRRRLQKSILEGPFPAETVFTLTEYHTMALKEWLRKIQLPHNGSGVSMKITRGTLLI
jgi:hypothetical protein